MFFSQCYYYWVSIGLWKVIFGGNDWNDIFFILLAVVVVCKCYKDKSHLLDLLNKINLVMSYDKRTISTAKQITCN